MRLVILPLGGYFTLAECEISGLAFLSTIILAPNELCRLHLSVCLPAVGPGRLLRGARHGKEPGPVAGELCFLRVVAAGFSGVAAADHRAGLPVRRAHRRARG